MKFLASEEVDKEERIINADENRPKEGIKLMLLNKIFVYFKIM